MMQYTLTSRALPNTYGIRAKIGADRAGDAHATSPML